MGFFCLDTLVQIDITTPFKGASGGICVDILQKARACMGWSGFISIYSESFLFM